MRIQVHPREDEYVCNKSMPPEQFAKYVVPWADVEFRTCFFGNILSQQQRGKDWSISINRLVIKEPIYLYATVEKLIFAFQFFIVEGYSDKMESCSILPEAGQCALFYLQQRTYKLLFPPGVFEWVHVELDPFWLEDLMLSNENINPVISQLRAKQESGLLLPPAPIDFKLQHHISTIMACSEKGPNLQMEIKTGIFNALNLYRKSIKETEFLQTHEVPHRDTLIDIWNRIKAAPNIHHHQISQLGKESFLHERALARNFRKLFKRDLPSFLLNQCMEKGYYLLVATDKSVNEIAVELGYNETSSFIRAFKRRYNISPKRLRKTKTSYS